MNKPCLDCIYARRAAAEIHRKEGWSACWLPLLFQAGKAHTPLINPADCDEDLHELSTLFAAKMDLDEAATGWAHNMPIDSAAKAAAMYNGILLVKNVRACPFKIEKE